MDSIHDQIEIENLVTGYTAFGDRGMLDEFIALFSQDAEFITPMWRAKGRAGMLKALTREDQGFFGPRRPTFLRHHLTTRQISLTDTGNANGRTYFVNYSDIGADHAGIYVDTFKRIDGRWLFSRREARVDWQADNSLYVPDLVRLSRSDIGQRALFGDA